jgi:hypothetical protein
MLEQSFAPASLARLTAEWPWDDEELIKRAQANPLPFDLVLLVNSAAPSIYAKQLYGYMVAHRAALARNGIVGADAPLVISLTSRADWATRVTHKYGNVLAPLYPSLWRSYDGGDFILAVDSHASPIRIPQSYYYRHTPGHNPLLVNHWIVSVSEDAESASGHQQLHQNIDLQRTADVQNRMFHTSPRKHGATAKLWQITTSPPNVKWSTYHGFKPVGVGTNAAKSGYWIMRCEKEIIAGHNDVWSQQAMETYVALVRETEFLRTQKPAPRQ